MKKILLLWLLVSATTVNAQFTFSVTPQAGKNLSGTFFKDFRTYYNTVNATTLDKKMGDPSFVYGYGINFGYRILRIASSVNRDYLWAGTSASFKSGAKRIVDYEYKLTTVDIGYFHPGEAHEFTIELGLAHCITSQYSYIQLPNGELDYMAGGVSANNNWTNLGMNLKFMYLKPISDNLLFHFQGSGIFINNENEVAPRIILGTEEATMTLKGVTIGAGLTYKFGEYIE
jgi:hypothetical protein